MTEVVEPKKKNKILWISILQGFTMFLVVLGHSDLAQRENIAWLSEMYAFFASFRMPLFLLVSGYLFYLTRIGKDRKYGDVMVDKLKRLGIPLVCFTIIGLGFKLLASSFVKNPVDFDGVQDIFLMLLGLKPNALGAMWFLQITLLYMAFYPLYRVVLKNHVATLFVLSLFVLAYYFFPEGVDFMLISKAMKLGVFFFLGMVIGNYRLDNFLSAKPLALLLMVALYVVCYIIGLQGLLLSVVGITMAMTFAKCAERYIPTLFSSFRNNTYQIYLISVFPQMAVEMLFRKMGCEYFMPFFIVNVLVGLYFPILVVLLVKKLDWKWVKAVIGL